MKIGIMGGTFDPVHIGHLVAAEYARTEAALDEVWFVPANVPPHKANRPKADGPHRLAMVNLAIGDNPRFRLCDVEFGQEGPSYSVHTMEKLAAMHPACEFHFIIGADMVAWLPNWHRVDDLARLVRFIGLTRPGFDFGLERLPDTLRARVTTVTMPQIDVSSTMIRDRLRRGRDIRYVVPEPVRMYIKENGLYV